MEYQDTELARLASEPDPDSRTCVADLARPEGKTGRTYEQRLYDERKARLARMGNGPAPKTVILKDTKAQDENGRLKEKITELSGQIIDLTKIVSRQRQYIRKLTGDVEVPVPTIAEIIHVVCDRYRVSRAELVGDWRGKQIVIPRQLVCYLARNTGHSLHAVARQINKDHTSVVHGRQRTEQRIMRSEDFRRVVEEVQAKIVEFATKRAQMAVELLNGGESI